MSVIGWYAVSVATFGVIAIFKDKLHAEEYAIDIRINLGEARGLTSAVSVFQIKE